MGPVWYSLRAGLRVEWRTAAGVALVVAVVGALVLTLTAGVFSTQHAPDRYSATLGDAYDVSLEQFSGRSRAPEIEALPAVAAVESATFVFGGVVGTDSEAPIEGLVFAGSRRAFGARLVAGREPDPLEAGEFVATRSWLAGTDAHIGDRFQLLTITQEQADEHGFDVTEPAGPTMPATLVGIIDGPSELQDPHPIAVFPEALLDAGDVGVASSIGLVALAGQATIDELRAQLDDLEGDAFGLAPAEWVPDDVRSAVTAQAQGLAVVAAIVGVAAIAVLGQLLTRRARRLPSQRLVLRAMGLTPRQLVAEPVGSTAVPVVIGSFAASGLAFLASGIFPVGFAKRVDANRGLDLDPVVHGLGSVLLAAALVGWVLISLSFGGRDVRGVRPVGLVDALARRVRPGPTATAMRFVFGRSPRGTAVRTPAAGLVLLVAALAGALTFGASWSRFVDEPSLFGLNFDLATGAGGEAVPEDLRALLEQDPDVTDVTLYGTQLASVGSVSLDVTGMDPIRGTLEPDVLAGRLARTPEEIALGTVAARQLGVDIGDEVVVRGDAGPIPLLVTGVAVVPGVEGGDGLGEGGVVTLAGLQRLVPGATPSVAAVRLRPGAVGAAARIGEAMGVGVGLPDRPPTVRNMDRVRSTPYVVAGALAALVVLSMGHQLVTSARRRRRDLAVLRALGADRRWITRVLYGQAMLLTTMVALLGAPLGIAAGRMVYRAFIDRIGGRADTSVPGVLLALAFVGLLVAGNLIAAVPSRRARRDVPGRVLTNE